jgi:hypothetical protein
MLLKEKGLYVSHKKKIIKRYMNEKGEWVEVVEEVSDYEGGEEIYIYNEKGELI